MTIELEVPATADSSRCSHHTAPLDGDTGNPCTHSKVTELSADAASASSSTAADDVNMMPAALMASLPFRTCLDTALTGHDGPPGLQVDRASMDLAESRTSQSQHTPREQAHRNNMITSVSDLRTLNVTRYDQELPPDLISPGNVMQSNKQRVNSGLVNQYTLPVQQQTTYVQQHKQMDKLQVKQQQQQQQLQQQQQQQQQVDREALCDGGHLVDGDTEDLDLIDPDQSVSVSQCEGCSANVDIPTSPASVSSHPQQHQSQQPQSQQQHHHQQQQQQQQQQPQQQAAPYAVNPAGSQMIDPDNVVLESCSPAIPENVDFSGGGGGVADCLNRLSTDTEYCSEASLSGTGSDHSMCEDPGGGESPSMEPELHQQGKIITSPDGVTHVLRARTQRKPLQERLRQKRQILQDMARPLKRWLYSHRDNPYPTKAEKVSLARDSQMTLTQVSNWFANARRRLKNTVKDPRLSWPKIIKRYNSYVEGNQELLSISSDDSTWDSEDEVHMDLPILGQGELSSQSESMPVSTETEVTLETAMDQQEAPLQHIPQGFSQQGFPQQAFPQQGFSQQVIPPQGFPKQEFSQQQQHQPHTPFAVVSPPDFRPPYPQFSPEAVQTEPKCAPSRPSVCSQNCDVYTESGDAAHEDTSDHHAKFKNTILQRYLNDSYQHTLQMQTPTKPLVSSERQRNPSGSLSSHDFEDISSSSRSSPIRNLMFDDSLNDIEEFSRQWPQLEDRADDDIYWKEISAALALVTLARAGRKVSATSSQSSHR